MKINNSAKYSTWSIKSSKETNPANKSTSKYSSTKKKPSKAGKNYLQRPSNQATRPPATSKDTPVVLLKPINSKVKTREP